MKLLLRGLSSSPTAAMRRQASTLLSELLEWQRDLDRWPDVRGRAPDGTPFVSVYADGRLRGCFGFDEGRPGERIARAFFLAMNDARFGGLARDDESKRVALVAYARAIAPMRIAEAPTAIAAGTHGLFYVTDDGRGAMLLPQVARDEHLDARGLLGALAKKAGVRELVDGRLFVFQTEEMSSLVDRAAWRGPIDEAASFLERAVDRDGRVTFMTDARTGARIRVGEMHHGRAAVVVQALEAAGRRRVASRARRRLERDIDDALRGRPPEGWPTSPPMVCGTLALAIRAGLDVAPELERLAKGTSFGHAPWYAGEVVAALGARATTELYSACITDLEKRPWAPWTLIAASTRGDRATMKRCAPALVASIRKKGAHEGGVGFAPVPETALTALTVEALDDDRGRASRSGVERARAFLRTWQNVPTRARGPIDPSVARGGFPLSPTNDALRSDVTAHALLALVGAKRRPI